MKTGDWNPSLYLQFDRERTRPSLDLIAKTDLEAPDRILDLGCGPGNAVPGLLARWPGARIFGIDTSAAMVGRARQAYPDQRWTVGDARDLDPEDRYPLVFSNAVLQWIPDHETLLPSLLKAVAPGGALAVQIPNYGAMAVSSLVDRIFPRFPSSDPGLRYGRIFTVGTPAFYDALVRPLVRRFELWETTYFHRMDSARSVVAFLESTGLKPYLDALEAGADREAFLVQVEDGVRELYPAQGDGTVLFPFRRLFFTAFP